MTIQQPSVGRVVHYVSYGTPGGEYPSVCRAAIVSETIKGTQACGLVVLNPEGLFFKRTVPQDEENHIGGSWHWPERV
jgi:hypothetical protein